MSIIFSSSSSCKKRRIKNILLNFFKGWVLYFHLNFLLLPDTKEEIIKKYSSSTSLRGGLYFQFIFSYSFSCQKKKKKKEKYSSSTAMRGFLYFHQNFLLLPFQKEEKIKNILLLLLWEGGFFIFIEIFFFFL